MALLVDAFAQVLHERTMFGVLWEMLLLVWIAMAVGVVAGWVWRPRWVPQLVSDGDQRKALTLPSRPSMHRFLENLGEVELMKNLQLGCQSLPPGAKVESLVDVSGVPSAGANRIEKARPAVSKEDLEYLRSLVEGTDGGGPWLQMMERSLPTVKFRAWRRDPDVGPPQFCSRTIFEDVTPEIIRDFFWDDEFRIAAKWDDMLLHHEILEECPETGMMVVRWIRKFPLFCNDREYIIGRRIWHCGRSFYCVTKGVPRFSKPGQQKHRRVYLYYSSWYIRPVESVDGKQLACEVTFFHQEDMGIPWELIKLGAQYGMWGTVKKIEPGLRAYQAAKESGTLLSRYALMAQINTEAASFCLGVPAAAAEDPLKAQEVKEDDHPGWCMNKFLFLGGVVLLACTLERSLLTKAAVFGVAGRFGRPGR